jgi:hypothetical protein
VQSVSNSTFGPLVAYLVPGATVLWGLSLFSPALRSLFASAPTDAPTIGGFLYLTVASVAAGMTVSALRWALIDTFHSWTGLPMPQRDFSKLGKNVEAFSLLIEIHYRHYLFYANAFTAAGIAYACYRVKVGLVGTWGIPDIGVFALEVIFFSASRSTLGRYYARSRQLLTAA